MEQRHKHHRNVAGGVLLAYSVVAFICFVLVDETWTHSAPTTPDRLRGLVYAHNEHGWITYFSAFQATSCALLFGTMFLFGLVGFAILPKRNVQRGHLWARWDHDDPTGGQGVGSLYGAIAGLILILLAGPPLVSALNGAGMVLSFG